MSKLNELRSLYAQLTLNTTEGKELLSKVKNRVASEEEVNRLLDIVNKQPNGAKILDSIKNFENNLVREIDYYIDKLIDME